MFITITSQSHEILNSKDNIYYLYIWVYTCVFVRAHVCTCICVVCACVRMYAHVSSWVGLCAIAVQTRLVRSRPIIGDLVSCSLWTQYISDSKNDS